MSLRLEKCSLAKHYKHTVYATAVRATITAIYLGVQGDARTISADPMGCERLPITSTPVIVVRDLVSPSTTGGLGQGEGQT